jgi:UDP-N-acetylmuramoyl-L-alanyl-D-glutamate--2,6-diaminopimelate ligase
MGTIAERLADEIILTDDNPRGEDSLQILDQIESGIQSRKVVRIPDRQQAIKYAIGECIAGDLVLIAGKGHEAEQIVGSKRIPLSDRNVVANLLGG